MKSSELQGFLLPFRGSNLILDIKKSVFAKTTIKQKDGCLIISVSSLCKNENDVVLEITKKIHDWYIAQARRYFTLEVEKAKAKYGFEYNDISIKDTVSRWGSCSALKNFNFNWRLVMAPPEILLYVVEHEIAHLTHMDHSKEFWNLVASRYPNYKKAKTWLQENANKIINFSL